MHSLLTAILNVGRGIADAAGRFVEPSEAGENYSRCHRLATVMLTGPFALGAVACLVAANGGLKANVLAGIAFAFVLAGLSLVAIRLRMRWTALFGGSLAAMSVFLGWVLAGAGGLTSPLLLLALALPFEAYWVGRDRNSLLAGLFAALSVIGLQLIIAFVSAPASAFPFWHWLVPVAYAAIVAPRLIGMGLFDGRSNTPVQTSLEDVLEGAIFRLDASGQVIDASGKIEELIGVAPNLLLGQSLFERVQVADRVAYLQAAGDARKGGKPVRIETRVRVARDGDARPAFVAFTAEFYPGTPTLLVLRDNSEVESLRKAMSDLRDELAKSEIAKATFLATVSHELRTPLNSIIGFADMLAFEIAGKLPDPRQREYASLIRESGGHLLAVVNAILDISRIESREYPVHCEPFAFGDAAASCHAMLAVQANAKSIELIAPTGPSVGEINADRRAVQQVIINLLSNAIKFTPAGGTVRLEARRNAKTITFDVHDNGIGMSPEDLAKVGRPFVQAQSEYSKTHDGVGLGLSIAKGLVALHDGAMSISSAPGAGTVVSVTLPVDGPSRSAVIPFKGEMSEGEVANGPFRKSA